MVVTGNARDGDADRNLRRAKRSRASGSDSHHDLEHDHNIDNNHDEHYDHGSCPRYHHHHNNNHRRTDNYRGARRDGTATDCCANNHRRTDYDRGAHNHRTRVSGYGPDGYPTTRPTSPPVTYPQTGDDETGETDESDSA